LPRPEIAYLAGKSLSGASRTRTGDLLGAISGQTFAPGGLRSLKVPVCRDSLGCGRTRPIPERTVSVAIVATRLGSERLGELRLWGSKTPIHRVRSTSVGAGAGRPRGGVSAVRPRAGCVGECCAEEAVVRPSSRLVAKSVPPTIESATIRSSKAYKRSPHASAIRRARLNTSTYAERSTRTVGRLALPACCRPSRRSCAVSCVGATRWPLPDSPRQSRPMASASEAMSTCFSVYRERREPRRRRHGRFAPRAGRRDTGRSKQRQHRTEQTLERFAGRADLYFRCWAGWEQVTSDVMVPYATRACVQAYGQP
jgi:hypothetical protein